MQDANKVNLDNLFSLYQLISTKPTGINLQRENKFAVIKTESSYWPNMVFDLKTEINSSIIDEIINVISGAQTNPLIIAENNAESAKEFKRKGFFPIDQWVGMFKIIEQKSISIPEHSSDITFLTIKREEDFSNWLSIVSASLFNSKFLDPSIFQFLSDNGVEVIMGTSKDEPVATAMIHYDTNVAGIYMVCVAESFRGKGMGKHLMNFCLNRIQDRGIRYCILQATRSGLGLYRSLEFESTGYYNLYMKIK